MTLLDPSRGPKHCVLFNKADDLSNKEKRATYIAPTTALLLKASETPRKVDKWISNAQALHKLSRHPHNFIRINTEYFQNALELDITNC